MSWKGTKENISNLPQSGNSVGDLWHVNEDGNEYAWDGSKWEALGGINLTPEQIEAAVAAYLDEHPVDVESFEIPITQSGDTYSTTVSAADILANKDNCVITLDGGAVRIPLDYYSVSNGTTYLFFGTTSLADNPPHIVNMLVQVTGNTVLISQGEYTIRSAPAVTASDNGKFLRVVNGAWAAATVPSAESNSFGGGA